VTLNFDVTRRILNVTGTRDTTTGWRPVDYSNEDTIEMINLGKGVTVMNLGAGQYARVAEVGQTADVVKEGDQIIHQGTYYHAEYVREVYAPGDNFHHRDVGLVRLPMYEASPDSTATWGTSPNDACERTKTWIDTYARDSEILKDDGSTQASWACIFSDPPYPLSREFRASSAPVQGLYTVDLPNTSSMMDAVTQAPYGYEEKMPIHVVTITSSGCSARQLSWRMQKELRHVFQDYPTGSLRSPASTRPTPVYLGSMILYDIAYLLNYRRDTT